MGFDTPASACPAKRQFAHAVAQNERLTGPKTSLLTSELTNNCGEDLFQVHMHAPGHLTSFRFPFAMECPKDEVRLLITATSRWKPFSNMFSNRPNQAFWIPSCG